MKRTAFLLMLIPVLFVMNLLFGSVHIPFDDVLKTLFGHQQNPTVSFIILEHRLPQTITALCVGASLSVAGLLLQTSFHNPLAGPSVLGISGGASLGVALVVLGGVAGSAHLGDGLLAMYVAAFVGASLVTMLLMMLSSLVRNNLVLLITGLLLGYLISAVITILYALSTKEGVYGFTMWGMGDFSSVSMLQLRWLCIPLVLLCLLSLLLIKPMSALLLGDMYAQNLGVNIRRVRGLMLFIVGAITAVSTTFCGPISFIGLAVPHIARMIASKSSFRVLLPLTMLVGAVVALLCNLLSALPSGMVLPINAVTPIIGVPVIIYVVIRKRG